MNLKYKPYQLLTRYIDSNSEVDTHNLTLFEAGFGYIGYVFDLYRNYKFHKYIGIDENYESAMQTFFSESIDPMFLASFDNLNSMVDRYNLYLSIHDLYIRLNHEQFSEIFDLQFQTEIRNYISQNKKSIELFDVGIFNKIFYLMDLCHAISIVEWFRDNSKQNSLLLITVNIGSREIYESNIKISELKDHYYSKEKINKLIEAANGEIIDSEFIDNYFLSLLIKANQRIPSSANE